MRLFGLFAMAAAFAAGWLAGRDYEFRLWERTNDAPVPETDPMASVQPSDPWPPVVRDNVMTQDQWDEMQHQSMHEHYCDAHVCPLCGKGDTYLEATTLAAIRRSAQSSDNPTGSM